MAVNTQNINAKSIAKYVLLPGIIPRAKELGSSGFGYLAFLFATIYAAVRILPRNHPYAQPKNIGTFTIRQAIAAAANNLQFNRKNIDQIVVFFAVLAAVILMFMQIILFLLTIFSGHAYAQPAGGPAFLGIFETQNPQIDIAFLMLDYVFGIPDLGAGGAQSFFGSNALQATGGPTPFQQGMHALFNFYNLALLLVGVLIFMYYIIVVVIETAETGVPFGRRFSKLYAPFRLIFAIGMLVPFGYGFNGSQYITLYAAKLGSSFATNGWLVFNDAMSEASGGGGGAVGGGGGASTNNPMGAPNRSLVAKPRTPPVDELFYFGSVYHACREMYSVWAPKNFQNPNAGTICIRPYVIGRDGQPHLFAQTDSTACQNAAPLPGGNGLYTIDDAINDFGKADVEVVLGEWDAAQHAQFAGSVRPYCGAVTISLVHDNPAIYTTPNQGGEPVNAGAYAGGVRAVQVVYWNMMRAILSTNDDIAGAAGNAFRYFGERAAHVYAMGPANNPCWANDRLGDGEQCRGDTWKPPASVFHAPLSNFKGTMNEEINTAYETFVNQIDLALRVEIRNRGWGGAGIWYNHIADMNGTFTGAVYATPSVRHYPEVLEFVKSERMKQNQSTEACKTFSPRLADGKQIPWKNTLDSPVAEAINEAYEYHNCEKSTQDGAAPVDGQAGQANPQAANAGGCGSQGPDQIASPTRGVTSNVIVDVISIIFGLNGLFDVRSCSAIDPATGQSLIHPLAQLSTVGKALVENAIRSMAIALGASFGGGMVGVLGNALGPALGSISGMFVGIATIGLTAGFILYYILPFLPFIYFFFAVGSWVKSIFEAMVGAPLWALAHLRIDGDGLPGRAAMPGYFLIFEIFLRPIVTVFGLIGGIAIFGALAGVLNNIFDLVVTNVSGAAPGAANNQVNIQNIDSFRRGIIDQFFFTIMYTILLYMMATSSFKMIDMVPRSVMRWINSGVPTFNDSKQDPTQYLTQYAAVGGATVSRQLMGGLQQGASGLGRALGEIGKTAMGEPPKKTK